MLSSYTSLSSLSSTSACLCLFVATGAEGAPWRMSLCQPEVHLGSIPETSAAMESLVASWQPQNSLRTLVPLSHGLLAGPAALLYGQSQQEKSGLMAAEQWKTLPSASLRPLVGLVRKQGGGRDEAPYSFLTHKVWED